MPVDVQKSRFSDSLSGNGDRFNHICSNNQKQEFNIISRSLTAALLGWTAGRLTGNLPKQTCMTIQTIPKPHTLVV